MNISPPSLADESGIQYYGRVMQPSTENGTVNVTIPSGLAAGKYTLNVFSEQYNGDYKTDYASEFEQITLTVEEVPAPKQDKAITLGTNGIKDPTAEGNTYYIPNSYIYFGVNDSTPIKWRVLDADKANDNSTDGIFLLSEYLLSSGVYFNKEKTSNFWQNSDAQEWCKTFASDLSNFSESEQSAMLGVEKTDDWDYLLTFTLRNGSLTSEEKMFFLSARELYDYVATYYSGVPGWRRHSMATTTTTIRGGSVLVKVPILPTQSLSTLINGVSGPWTLDGVLVPLLT